MTPRMTDEELDALELKLTKPMQLHGMAILSDADVTALLTECRRARAAEGAGFTKDELLYALAVAFNNPRMPENEVVNLIDRRRKDHGLNPIATEGGGA